MLDLYKNNIIAHVQIHDELCISIKDQEQANKIVEIMQDAVTLEVPNKVDCELANNWGEIK
jgi:DNA polymerase I-like protein with 3'-5' exonuclease and polymerase domains